MFLRHKSTILIIILALILVTGGVWYAQRPTPEIPPPAAENESGQAVNNSGSAVADDGAQNGGVDTSEWQTYTSPTFSYKYPKGWTCRESKDYNNGQIIKGLCGITYKNTGAFDDGINISFGFVPQHIATTDRWSGKLWSEIKMDGVQNQQNARTYSNNNFIGWISMKNQVHTLRLVARYLVDNGYYEVEAYAMGDTKTDEEYKKIIDKIITSFEER